MRNLLVAAFMLQTASVGGASAGATCDVPVAEWQPRETLRSKLEADGWLVRSIKAQDGCYAADVTDKNGVEIHAVFDPKTLKLVDMAEQDSAG
ncbi:PepSY domain-containing protein [Mesorhizobium sp. CN2-181]|uniref:PepSY domain-containing protein n=1 Tax=Mesorhizobium yinganensis TaxID=3157707 RepID=UPI0032B73AEA